MHLRGSAFFRPIIWGVFSAAVILLLAACSGGEPARPSGDVLYRPTPAPAMDSGELAQLAVIAERNKEQIAALDTALVQINRKLGGDTDLIADIALLKKTDSSQQRDMTALDTRISSLESGFQTIQDRLDGLERAIKEALAQASAVRALINRQALESLEDEGHIFSADSGQVYAVHLASYRSQETAKAGWETMQRRFGALLGGLSARLEPLDLPDAGGEYLRLLAGPFEDISPALALCNKLKEVDMFCQISPFSGKALP